MNVFLLLASPVLCCPSTDPPVSLWNEVEKGVIHPATGHVYYKAPRGLSIDTARRLASELRGSLVAIGSKEEEAWIIDELGLGGAFWIGLSAPFDRWDNGEPIAYENWREEPELGRWSDSPVTLVCWKDRKADGERFVHWLPKHGEFILEQFPAIIEVDPEVAGSELDPRLELRPSELYSDRGSLLMVIEDLRGEELAELDESRCPHLHALREESMWTIAAGADLSGDTLAGWGMLLTGVGLWKSQLRYDDLGERDFWRLDGSFFCKLEEIDEGYTTASLLDNPLMTGCFVSEDKVDIRYTSAGYREASASLDPRVLLDLQQRPGPISILVGWSGSLGRSKKERQEGLSRLDGELGRVLEAVRGRESYEQEQWLVALASPGPARVEMAQRKSKKNDEGWEQEAWRSHPYTVPVLLCGLGFPLGETSRTVNLTDLPATISHHLGGGIYVTSWLDGRVLKPGGPLEHGVNLLFNGDAEAREAGIRDHYFETIPGWRLELPVSVQRYRQIRGAGNPELPGPPDRGTGLFICQSEEGARMIQCVDLRSCDVDVDSGKLHFTLSGWFGGFSYNSGCELRVEFLKEDGKLIHAKSLPLVEAGDRRRELGATRGYPDAGLLERSLEGKVPRRARCARIILEREAGNNLGWSLADTLYFDLH